MRVDTAFRLSTFLTLALATLCLSSADQLFLPDITLFVIPVEILVAVAFALEGYWALTPLASNLIGLVIAMGSGIWIALNLIAPSNQLIDNAPYPAALLPFGGPVLMVLMLAKLFRPKKLRDYWVLHTIGLMQVALACILAGESTFALWLFLYLACAVWSLMLFHSQRELQRAADDSRGVIAKESPGTHHLPPDSRRWGLGSAGCRALIVGITGVILFLITPQLHSQHWDLLASRGTGQMQTGYSNFIDLTATGPIQLNDQVALNVYVEDADGKPKLDLDPNTRWRGSTLDYYQNGRWLRRRINRFILGNNSPVLVLPYGAREDLPDLGPDRYYVTFNLDLWQAGGLFLAEPVSTEPSVNSLPVRALGERIPWDPRFHEWDNVLIPPRGPHPRYYRYLQVLAPRADSEDNPATGMTPSYLDGLLQQPVSPRFRSWTRDLLDRLAAEQRLTRHDLATEHDPHLDIDRILSRNRAKVAQALSDHLANSGEFSYRLEIRRDDPSIDVTEDFLCNVKQGFCEQYAAGLTLMLRSLGIPARIVNGFYGAESRADGGLGNGIYVVRQSQAHSWVEALIDRPGPGGNDYRWLTLDPTPARETQLSDGSSWSRWWLNARDQFRDLWKNLFVDYNADRQNAVISNLRSQMDAVFSTAGAWLKGPWQWRLWESIGIVVIALTLTFWLRRRLRTPAAAPNAVVPLPAAPTGFYNQWLAMVFRHFGARPLPGQTPREFGDIVTQTLQRQQVASSWLDFPRQLVHLYYYCRYGHYVLPPAKEAELEYRLQAFDAAVIPAPNPSPSDRASAG
jgi:transglutaminase-like putative cysteine protease